MALDRLIVHWRKGGLRWLLLDEFESAVREDIGELSGKMSSLTYKKKEN